MWPGPFEQTFFSHFKESLYEILSLIGPVVLEKMFENVDGLTPDEWRDAGVTGILLQGGHIILETNSLIFPWLFPDQFQIFPNRKSQYVI